METSGTSPAVHHLGVRRTARYVTLGAMSSSVRDVWIVCHGYGQLATRFIERFKAIAEPHRLIVAPEALSRFYVDRGAGFHGPSSQVGATWMTAEDRESEIEDYVAYLDAVYDQVFAHIPRDGVTLRVLGFSQGTATVIRWLAAGKAKADSVILWAGSIPPELSSEGASRIGSSGRPVSLVAGTEDAFITSKVLDQQRTALASHGIGVDVRQFKGGHEIDASTLMSIANSDAPKGASLS